MKKKVVFSFIISLIINSICLLINLFCAVVFKFLPLSIKMSGGEWIGYYGFGISLEKIFGITINESGFVSNKIGFDLLSYLIPFIIIFIIVLIIKIIISKTKK